MVRRAQPTTLAGAYDEYVADVHGFLGYRLSNPSDVDDLTQLTFERALRAWPRYDPVRAPVKTWLLAIARNLVIDHYRSAKNQRQDPLPSDEALPALPEPELRGFGDPRLVEALRRLPVREREIIALRFGGDLTTPQLAPLVGLSVANVQQILSRTLRSLREELERAVVLGARAQFLSGLLMRRDVALAAGHLRHRGGRTTGFLPSSSMLLFRAPSPTRRNNVPGPYS